MRAEKAITATSNRHRLTLYSAPEGNGANFHSLAWAVRKGSGWCERTVITREAFQPPSRHRRWVANLHSFDPETGLATIQVAEGDAPVGARSVHYTYSWREWDLELNCEVRLLAVCESPFDPYEPTPDT